ERDLGVVVHDRARDVAEDPRDQDVAAVWAVARDRLRRHRFAALAEAGELPGSDAEVVLLDGVLLDAEDLRTHVDREEGVALLAAPTLEGERLAADDDLGRR